jgi:hypothetical protein
MVSGAVCLATIVRNSGNVAKIWVGAFGTHTAAVASSQATGEGFSVEQHGAGRGRWNWLSSAADRFQVWTT